MRVPEGRLLAWNEADALDALLAPTMPALARAGINAAFVMGRVRAAVATTASGALAGLLAQGGDGWWCLVGSLGSADEAAQRAAFRVLTADARLVIWEDALAPSWLPWFADLGAAAFERVELVQAVARARHAAERPGGGAVIAPWPGGAEGEQLLDALAAASAGTLNGVFQAAPAPPTVAAVRSGIARTLASVERPFLPEASFVARLDGRAIGLVLTVAGTEPGEVLLYELLVDPAARGAGIARRLIMAVQDAVLATGRARIRFLALGDNDPVMRLFHDDELVERSSRRFGRWQAGEAASGAALPPLGTA